MIESLRPIQVLEAAREKGKLPHSMLFYGNNYSTLVSAVEYLGAKILKSDQKLEDHPDFFSLRPAGKGRVITVEGMRKLIHDIQHSPNLADSKIALIHEAERLNLSSGNAFLKTLEEPPGNTIIVLLTSKPYSILSTIRSRCFRFNFSDNDSVIEDAGWVEWLKDYEGWLGKLQEREFDKKRIAELTMTVYALITRFQVILTGLAKQSWAGNKENLPENISDEAITALEVGNQKGLRGKLFSQLEQVTFSFFKNQKEGTIPTIKLSRVIECLEKNMGLVEVNMNESVALEDFLLTSLKVWSS